MLIFVSVLVGFLYLAIGYAVVKQYEFDGEVFIALIFLWPILVIGRVTKSALEKVGSYHPILGSIFTVVVVLLILTVFFISTTK